MTRYPALMTLGLIFLPTSMALAWDEDPRPVRREPVLPCKLGLEIRWQAFQKHPTGHTLQQIGQLIQQDPQGQQLVRRGRDRFTSLWSGIDRWLQEHPKAALPLGTTHGVEARALLSAARQAEDAGQLLAVYRRYPWLAVVHQALLEQGEKNLRQGHAGLALRYFSDVLTHTRSQDLRARAQVGAWLALAQDPQQRTTLDQSLKRSPPSALYPWMGKKIPARNLRDHLPNNRAATPRALTLSKLNVQPLASVAQAGASWLDRHPRVYEKEGIFLGGPNRLFWYDLKSNKLRWSHTSKPEASVVLWSLLVPGPFAPPVANGLLYTRWGVTDIQPDPPLRDKVSVLTHVAAFRTDTGKLVWSTEDRQASPRSGWGDLCPLSDPTFSEGRLYILACDRHTAFTPIYLVCLAAQNGRVLWKRELVTCDLTLRPAPTTRQPTFRSLDVSHFGNAVTVVGGVVYCLTNAGVIACCDARDGAILWGRFYPRDPGTAPSLGLLMRQGASPLFCPPEPRSKRPALIVFLPRDALDILAVRADTGELQWRHAAGSGRCLGAMSGLILLAGSKKLVARDLSSGKVRWERTFSQSIHNRAFLDGTEVLVGTSTRLYQLKGTTGQTLETRPWPGVTLQAFTLAGPNLVGPHLQR